MVENRAVVIDMDQEVTLTVRVSVGERYHTRETLSQELHAPLFIVRDVQVKELAEKLRQGVMERFMVSLREDEERRMRMREAPDTEKEDDENP